ncbi:MAG: hypothetical protein H7Y89_05855, partial [Steroidobacteraceae bacterium]|nr:hypothetical protein [Steroidobacteraceae bacterium]
MNGRQSKIARAATIFGIAMFAGVMPAAAQAPPSYSGLITMLEGWRQGNVAFTLSATGVPCNGQFILNKSDAGTPKLFAILVAAKAAGTPVRAYFGGCGPAEG